MNYTEIFNLINSNVTVWGVLFLIGTGLWMIALQGFDKKVSKK